LGGLTGELSEAVHGPVHDLSRPDPARRLSPLLILATEDPEPAVNLTGREPAE